MVFEMAAWLTLLITLTSHVTCFTSPLAPTQRAQRYSRTLDLRASALTDETVTAQIDDVTVPSLNDTATMKEEMEQEEIGAFMKGLQEKIGSVDESRIAFPEYQSGQVSRMFSSLEYKRDGEQITSSQHATGSVVGAAALIAGTTIGAGVLALPSATINTGFLPSTFGMLSAYVYMTMSGLLIAELTLNRMAQTGKPGLGLLELYESSLGKSWSAVGTSAYFFLHYAVMVAYIAQGGKNVEQLLPALGDQNGAIVFTAVMSLTLFASSSKVVENFNNVMVLGVAASFLSIVAYAAGTADFGALIDASNQHPDQIISCLPILFLSMVYQNVVPTVVTNLEGDRSKITKAIVGGTTLPLVMFTAWNAVCLGNVYSAGVDLTQTDPVAFLQAGETGAAMLAPLVTCFSVLALVTSIVGFCYGLVDAWTDKFQLPVKGEEYEKWKPALFALVFVPPLLLSMTDPNIFYRSLDYGGAFGVSTLFLVLPPLMVWQERYRETEKPLATSPMVPFGKLPLASMWKTAGTLIVEQGAEKLGFFDWIAEVWEHFESTGHL